VRRLYEQQVFPRFKAFEPDIIFISAGFDSHADDPLGRINLYEVHASYSVISKRR
jgi:acetoin utilization deacetylase AcuC-like enzyme